MTLTREQLLIMFGVAGGTRLSKWPFELQPETVQQLLDHDAEQRQQLEEAEARIQELEQALRLHLAVAPDDPILNVPPSS